MSKLLIEHKVLTFDCYGTLIDWETGIWDAAQPLLAHNQREDVSREDLLRLFAQTESAQQAATPGQRYPEVLSAVHRTMADRLDLSTTDKMDATFGASVPHWPAFPDSAEALRALHHHFALVILSNVDRAGFAASNRKLGVTFDAVYTAEDVGSYKPDPANFEYLVEHVHTDLDFDRATILHTAQSLYHDHAPAREAGIANAWIDRRQLSAGGDWGATSETAGIPEHDFLFFSLADMAAAVHAELA